MAFGVKSKKLKEKVKFDKIKKQNRFEVIKLNQYFGGGAIFRIVDMDKSGKDMHHVKKEFNSRKDANKYIIEMKGR